MGIKKVCKQWFLKTFPKCVGFDPPGRVGLVSIDMMQYLKAPLPDDVVTTQDLLNYLVRQITVHFENRSGATVVVANFDLGSPYPKKLVAHKQRYADKRCVKCKSHPDLRFDPACSEPEKCVNKDPLPYKDNHRWLHADLTQELPVRGKHWIRFAGDSRNLRAELYPLLMNELLLTYPRCPNQMIIVNGLPARTTLISPEDHMYENGYSPKKDDTRVRVIKWLPHELPVPLVDALFRVVFMIKWMPPTPARPTGWVLMTECPEMQNDILEADNSVYFFARFFPDLDQMIVINDGDALPIGLLRMAEEFRGENRRPPTTWLRLPYRDLTEQRELFPNGNVPPFQYINLTQMYAELSGFKPFLMRDVQNPVATMVFLTILAGTDFFQNFCPGIGFKTSWHADEAKRKKQKNGVWDTFFEDLEAYSHMVQWYSNSMIRDPTAKRRIVVDRDLFRVFTYKCYANKYMKGQGRVSVSDLRVRCSKFKRETRRLPTRDTIDVWAQNATWVANYWVNACRDIYIDPLERVEDQSYWGYETEGIAASVHPKQKPVDEVFKRHFYRRRQKAPAVVQVSPAKKRKVSKKLGAEIKEMGL